MPYRVYRPCRQRCLFERARAKRAKKRQSGGINDASQTSRFRRLRTGSATRQHVASLAKAAANAKSRDAC